MIGRARSSIWLYVSTIAQIAWTLALVTIACLVIVVIGWLPIAFGVSWVLQHL